MPPRLALIARTTQRLTTQPYQPLATFLYPCLIEQQRSASILTSLSDNRSAYNKKIRRGRGPASGKGKTSGRGHKGQGQHGKVPYNFNGGQTPDIVVSGTRGFENKFSVDMTNVNLDKIQAWIDKGRLDPKQPITIKHLHSSRCIHGVKDGVTLLARGRNELRDKVDIIVSKASDAAIAAVEKAGGSVTTRFYSPFAIKKIMQGEMDPLHSLASNISFGTDAESPPTDSRRGYRYRLPDPVSRKSLEYYRDPAKRGYLSHTLAEDASPSLYFRTPSKIKVVRKNEGKDKSAAKGAENKLW